MCLSKRGDGKLLFRLYCISHLSYLGTGYTLRSKMPRQSGTSWTKLAFFIN